jgi:hypothetical protein
MIASMRANLLSFLIAGLLFAACKHEHATPSLPLQALRVGLSSETEIGKMGPAGHDIVRRPWVGPIIQVLAEETPDGAARMRRNRIAGSGIAPDRLFEHGVDNMRKAYSQPIREQSVTMAKARVEVTRFPDNHTAARLLLSELWSKLAAEAGGALYAAAPARDIVLWTTSREDADQHALRRQAQIAYQSRSEPISTAILRWTGTGWALEDANPIAGPAQAN